jgi:hypothetical protein
MGMLVSGMTTATDRTDALSIAEEVHGHRAEVPLDYLVKALNRAVERFQAPGSEDTEHRT